MIIAKMYRNGKTWDDRNRCFSDKTRLMECVGSDGFVVLDARKTLYNLEIDAFDYIKRLRKVQKFDAFRIHRVNSLFDTLGEHTALTKYIKIDYENSLYLKGE